MERQTQDFSSDAVALKWWLCLSVDWEEKPDQLFFSEMCHYRLPESNSGSIVYRRLQREKKKLIPIIVGWCKIFNSRANNNARVFLCARGFYFLLLFCYAFIPRVAWCSRFKLLFSSTNSFVDFAHFQSELWNENVCWRLEWRLCWEVFQRVHFG